MTDDNRKIKNILMIFLFVLIFYILKQLAVLIIPLILALLFAILFQPLILRLASWKIPRVLILVVVSLLSLSIIFVIFNVFLESFSQILDEQEYLTSRFYYKLEQFLTVLNSYTSFDLGTESAIEAIKKFFDVGFISKTAGGLAKSVSKFSGLFIMFAIYYIIFLSSLSNYQAFLQHVGGKGQGKRLVENFEVVQKSIFSYLVIKTIISSCTGLIAGLICWGFNIRFALIFGIFTFLLNFIPTIGSIIASLFPFMMAIVQYNDITKPLVLIVILTSIQMVMGNLVEPKITGDKLRLNTITVIFGLVFWGYIWQIPGMILSVPFMVTLKLILEQISGTEMIARAMENPFVKIRSKADQKT